MTSTSLLVDGVDVVLRQRVAQRLLARDVGTEARLEQLPGRLAGPEAGNAHFACQLLERGVDGSFEFVGRDRDVQLDLVARRVSRPCSA